MRSLRLARIAVAVSISAGGATLGLATSAFADGYQTRYAAAPCCAPTWTGFYVGVHAGYLWSDADWDFVSRVPGRPDRGTFVFDVDQSPKGRFGGGQVGYNWQTGSWVFGVEASYSGVRAQDSLKNTDTRTAADDVWTTKIEDLFLATGRLGYSWGPSLIYLKGGYASARVELSTLDTTGAPGFASASNRHNGWTIGAGWEHKFTPNISFGLEYDYIDLNSKEYTQIFVPVSAAGDRTVDNVAPTIHTVSARLNFHFYRDEPRPLK
jgi:outer membrane immunogenic protein